MFCFLTAPHDGGGPEDEFNEKFYSMQAPHGRGHASRTGARCAHTGRRDTQPPGAMRNLRVPENTHSGDW